MDLIIKQLEKEAGGKTEFDEINGKVLLLTQQCEKFQRLEAKYKKEIDQALEENESLKQNDKMEGTQDE